MNQFASSFSLRHARGRGADFSVKAKPIQSGACKYAIDMTNQILALRAEGYIAPGIKAGILTKREEAELNFFEADCPHGLLVCKVMKVSVKVWLVNKAGNHLIYERFTR
jgi:hypothetical protein